VTRFVIDPDVLIRIAEGSLAVHEEHQLVAPGSLRSQAQARLYAAVRDGKRERAAALTCLERITEIKVRLLNDRVSRNVAWKLAEQLGLEDTALAEYLAVAQLQADALVSLDGELKRLAKGLVPVAGTDALARVSD
jgi:predicted nucleic acid-binding protein